jgi:hypothetical protein
MRKKISVMGKGVKIAAGLSRVAEVGEDFHGADVVVLAEDADLAAVARSAPAAALVVTGDGVEDRCQKVFEATLFPRARIVGVPDAGQLDAILEAIVLERDEQQEVVAMSDGRFGPRSARIGRGGIREFV